MENTWHEFKYDKDKIVSIQQNDCISFLNSLPEKSIDIIATDPAYSGMNNKLQLGKGRIVGEYKNKGTTGSKWFGEFKDTTDNYITLLSACKRVLKNETGHIYLMFDSFSLISLSPLVRYFFDVKNIITWDKVNIGMGHYFRRRHEFVLFCTNGNNRKIKTRSLPDIWRFKRVHNAKYPTQKPVELFQTMIYASCEEGFTVCDPFLGSGSSAIAAIKNKCNYVGCDSSSESLSFSRHRIGNYINSKIDIYQEKSLAIDNFFE